MARTVPDPSVHVFLGGAPEDLVTIAAMLATMPMCTYGQVVIESDEQLDALDLPRRVQLRRVAVSRSVLTGEPLPGESVARAADAWLTEWMPEAAATSASSLHAWIGCTGSEVAAEAGVRVEQTLRAGLSHS